MNAAHPICHDNPVGIILRSKLPAAGMKRISSRLGREGVDQESAGSGVSRNHLLHGVLEVALRLLFSPLRSSRGQGVEMKSSVRENVAPIAASMPRALLQENWLDLGFKELEVKNVAWGGIRWLIGRYCRAVADPIGDHFPFRVILRCPELATCVGRIAARLMCQGMKQQAAPQWIGRSDQSADDREVSPRLWPGPGRVSW